MAAGLRTRSVEMDQFQGGQTGLTQRRKERRDAQDRLIELLVDSSARLCVLRVLCVYFLSFRPGRAQLIALN